MSKDIGDNLVEPLLAKSGKFWASKKKAQKGYNPLHQVRLHESMFK